MTVTRVRERLEDDTTAIGARATTLSPAVVEAYADIGLDFTWVDFEHTGSSSENALALERLARAGDAAGVDLLVRLSSGAPELVRKALDAGVRTLLVPRVETADQARDAVYASRFSYDGTSGGRGAAAGRASAWGNPPDDYAAREDGSVCVGAMVETETGVENVEDIVSVPGLGFVFVGPSDLSISLGQPFETSHPRVREAISAVERACIDARVPLGGIANDADAARSAIDDGYSLLRIGDEIAAARTVLDKRLGDIYN